MIFVNCNHCDELYTTNYEMGKVEKHKCEKCGKTIWIVHSNIDPVSYTDEDFKKEYSIDEKTKVLTKK